MLDFGILRTLDEPKTVKLNLGNSGNKAIHITVSECLVCEVMKVNVACNRWAILANDMKGEGFNVHRDLSLWALPTLQ